MGCDVLLPLQLPTPPLFTMTQQPLWTKASLLPRIHDHTHTHTHTTLGRTPLDGWSTRRRDLYLTTHNRQTSMPPLGFELPISAGERLQIHALERAATGSGTPPLASSYWMRTAELHLLLMAEWQELWQMCKPACQNQSWFTGLRTPGLCDNFSNNLEWRVVYTWRCRRFTLVSKARVWGDFWRTRR